MCCSYCVKCVNSKLQEKKNKLFQLNLKWLGGVLNISVSSGIRNSWFLFLFFTEDSSLFEGLNYSRFTFEKLSEEEYVPLRQTQQGPQRPRLCQSARWASSDLLLCICPLIPPVLHQQSGQALLENIVMKKMNRRWTLTEKKMFKDVL